MLSKPIRTAIAIVLRSSIKPSRFLTVKRPDEDADLPGNWGLPATTLHLGELPEDAARRVCREKLGCEGVPIRLIGTMFQKRNAYDLVFMDMEVLLTGDKQPDFTAAHTNSTVYVDQAWTNDVSRLIPAARHGSCCSTIFLTDQKLLERKDWVESLEGSNTVG